MRALVGRTAARQQHRCAIASGLGSASADQPPKSAMRTAATAPSASASSERAPAADRAAPGLEPRPLPHYADYPIDRASELRTDAKALAALFEAPQSRLLPVLAPSADSAARVLVVAASTATPAPTRLAPAWVRPASASAPCLADGGGFAGCVFLGLDSDGAGVFAGRVRPDAADGVVAAAAAAAEGGNGGGASQPQWMAARTAGPDMSAGDAALVATAAGVASWHAAAQYDGSTGLPTQPRRGGHSRGVVAVDGASSSAPALPRPPRALYPRVDPATIMLVRQGPWALLGRKAEWPPGRWSTLAGFLECGETFEQCVARETREESGVPVDLATVQYVESQPWPFPRSLMVGFYASPVAAEESSLSDGSDPYALLPAGAARRAAMDVGLTQEELRRYLLPRLPAARPTAELEDVRWFYRGWVRQALARHHQQAAAAAAAGGGGGQVEEGLFHVPGHYSLGNRLVHGWLRERCEGAEDDFEADEAGGSSPLARFPAADIGEPGTTFKYVLLRVFESSGCSKLAVWGHPAAEYHNHILQRAKAHAQALGLGAQAVEVLGGGRIRHDEGGGGSVHVYGYSAAFGSSPHEVSAAILQRWFPFSSVTVSYEGY
jgi:NAD+ diphosphatase